METFFHHRRLLATPVVVALVVSAGFALTQPPTYQASARVWFAADSFRSTSVGGFPRPLGDDPTPDSGSPQPGASSGLPDLTPAEVAKGVFDELLGTPSFCVAVGHRGPLAGYLAQPGHGLPPSDPPTTIRTLVGKLRGGGSASGGSRAADDALETREVQRVTVATTGPQIVTLTFDFPDPEVAAGTLKALLDQFTSEVLASQRTLAPEDLAYVTRQVADEQELAAGADAEVAEYLAQHPELGSPNPPPDLTLAGLQQAADTAHQRYAYLIRQRDQAQFQVNALNAGSSPQFHVVDSPSAPPRPNSLLTTVLSGLGGGLGVGLLVAGTALAVLRASPPGESA